MDDSDDETTNHNKIDSNELDRETRLRLNINSYRSVGNSAFHDGYDEGRQAVSQAAFDAGYKEAFEQHFILSTLKGVAHALKSSYNLNRPTSTSSTPSRLSTSSNRSARGSSIFDSPTPAGDTSCSSSSSSSNVSNPTGSSNINVNISSNHLTILESLKFDNASDIESIKKDLIRICHENRLEILAHYISQIG